MHFDFEPARVIFEQDALRYPLGEELLRLFREKKTEIGFTSSHNRVTGIPGRTRAEAYLEGKKTLVVGVRRSKEFATCKPSAHYQLPLATSCPGRCEYCYLQTTLGKKPYLRVYVNTGEILATARDYIDKRKPATTVFEGAATSDPLPTEPYSGNLAGAIRFFGGQEHGRFRFVTKFTAVDSLLDLPHNGHTRFRFSVNTEAVIGRFEHATPPLAARLAAARRVAGAGYPLGFLVAPILAGEGWENEYRQLFLELAGHFGGLPGLTLEFITHRFTRRARENILEVFPQTKLDLDESSRTFKFGQFGYGKFVYPGEHFNELKEYFYRQAEELLPAAQVEYFV